MRREEIENALLTVGRVDIDAAEGGPIEITAPKGRRLTEIVLDHLRSSNVADLLKNTIFFDALESAFREDLDEAGPDLDTRNDIGEVVPLPESRTWRLKKIKTKGFGGLNATLEDVFEFDAAGREFCIEGQNGSGKSSLANAVLFAMTGKLHRDQYGIWSDVARSESVMSDQGQKLGDWPPIATYPSSWDNGEQCVDVSVRLTFGNEADETEIEAKRRLHGHPGALEQEVSIDSRLTAIPTLIEAGLLMPMRIQHIRMPESDDSDQLLGLIRQLIGLEPLLDVANLVDKLTHRNQRFLKYAKDKDAEGKAQSISRLLSEAQERIEELGTSLDLIVQVDHGKPIPDEKIKELHEGNKELSRRLADGFQSLGALAFEGFNPNVKDHRERVQNTVNQLYLDARRQNEFQDPPTELKGIAELAEWAGHEKVDVLKSTLCRAKCELEESVKWAERQRRDTLLRLKATAAVHFADCDVPLCPLCEQPITGSSHRTLVEELRTLKANAQAAQTHLADACRRIEQDVKLAAKNLVPSTFMQVGRYGVKRNIEDRVRSVFVDARHVAKELPGFTEVARDAANSAFEAVDEVEFGSMLPAPEEGDDVGRVGRFVDHLEDVIKAAESWKQVRQPYRDAWALLFSKDHPESLTAQILLLENKIRDVEPFQEASKKVEQTLNTAEHYNKIVRRQAQREEIVAALKPLVKLRDLVNLTTRRTISEVSDLAKLFHTRIYNPEELAYNKTAISEFRGKQSLSFQAKLSNSSNWCIDASLIANVSWMRGILWSFVFAIRERAIKQAGRCPFELIFLDDPQITFDTRNLKGWVQFLSSSGGLRQSQGCQIFVTTHSRLFAMEMMGMPSIRMAQIETGRPWSKSAQVVQGDFAKVRFSKMIAENSDDRARSLIADIRVLAETLLKHAIEPFEPVFVTKPEATLGRIVERIVRKNAERQTPYTDPVFGQLIAAKSSFPEKFRQLSEPHHTMLETITVREAKQLYEFWQQTLFPAVQNVWEEYRFLQKSIVGEVASISLPVDCNHSPLRSTALAAVQPTILGRVSAYSDGHAASAIRIDHIEDHVETDLGALGAYRLEKDTLSPVACVGDILLTRLDRQCRVQNLIVEDRGTHRVARRWLADAATPALAVLAASSSNPREVPPAIISRAKGANRRKIVGVLFAADGVQPGEALNPKAEVTDIDPDNFQVANLIANTNLFEVQGSSAEPIALDRQYLLAKPATDDLARSLRSLDSRPVIAEDSEGCAFFKRLRALEHQCVFLESLDNTGTEGPIRLSTKPGESVPFLTRVREVVGVLFDKA